MAKSTSDRFIEKAFSEGYYATEGGKVFDSNRREVKTSSNTGGHLKTTLYFPDLGINKGSCPVLIHRMVVYFFKGDELFQHRLVRHLNGDPTDNRIANLKLGNHSENRADIDPDVIRRNSKKNAHLLVGRNRKLSDEDVIAMREVRRVNGTPYKKLAEIFGVTTMTAHRACAGKSWSNIEEEE